LKFQKDEAVRLTGIAETNEKLAKKNEEEAVKQTGIAAINEKRAKKNEEEAVKQTGIAKKNEQTAKTTADATVQQMTQLVERVYERLQSKRLAVSADLEVRKLREQVLANLRESMKEISKKIDASGASPFGDAGTKSALGTLLAKLGQSEEALKLFEQAHEDLIPIVNRNPDNDVARANLAVSLLPLGHLALNVKGDARAARDYYRKALAGHEEILAKPRDGYYQTAARDVELKRVISHDNFNLGEAYLALGDPAAARNCFEKSLAYRKLWSEFEKGGSLEAISYVMQAEMYLGIAASHLGDEKDAQAHFEAASTIGANLAPRFLDYRADLADVQGAHGDALLRLGKTDDALKLYKEALNNLEAVFKKNPENLQRQPLLAQTHERLGAAYAVLKQKPEAGKHYKDAMQLRVELFEIERTSLAKQAALVLAFARAGKIAEATGNATAISPRMKDSTELQLQLARCWTACAVANADKKAEYTDRAIAALRLAVQDTYKADFILQTDVDLMPLRSNPAFQQILKEVKARQRN
jgi:tetratricopeptide (TPR) repeat protein